MIKSIMGGVSHHVRQGIPPRHVLTAHKSRRQECRRLYVVMGQDRIGNFEGIDVAIVKSNCDPRTINAV